MFPKRAPFQPLTAPEYPKTFQPVPEYKPRKGGLAARAQASIQAKTKQRRDFQKERLQPREPIKVDTWLNKAQLAAKNAKRRNKRNSDGFAFDADCVSKPSGGSGNAARYEPTPKQRADQNKRSKKHEHARRWC